MFFSLNREFLATNYLIVSRKGQITMKSSFRSLNWGMAVILITTMLVVSATNVTAKPSLQGTAAATQAANSGGSTAVKLNPDVSGSVDLWHFWASPVRRNGVHRLM